MLASQAKWPLEVVTCQAVVGAEGAAPTKQVAISSHDKNQIALIIFLNWETKRMRKQSVNKA